MRLGELVSAVGLIATCLLLYRFFRGGIMEFSFALFTAGSVFFFVGVFTALLVESGYLPENPFDVLHLVFEITFVLFLLAGLLLLNRRWAVQHQDPNYGK